METKNIREFLDYYEKVRQRTVKVIACIPPEKYDWSYREGKFSFADIIRHLATIERYMYGENAQRKPSRYPGHGKELADGPENVLEFFHRMHGESMEIFGRLSDEDLQQKCVTPGGTPITVWKWPREDGRRARGLREDRGRHALRRSARRAHDRPALNRARRRSGAGASPGMHR